MANFPIESGLDNMSKLSWLLIPIVFMIIIAQVHIAQLSEQRVVDALGRSVTIKKYPERVISIAPSVTELLTVMELDDLIVGADGYSLSDWFMDVGEKLRSRGVMKVGEYWWSTISVEKIIELSPDLIIADKGAHRQLLEVFEAYNLTVLFLNGGSAKSVNDVYEDIYIMGQVFNKIEDAEKLVSSIEASLARGKEQLSSFHSARVLVVIDFWQGIWVAGKATYIDDLLARLGLVNVAMTVGWSIVNVDTIAKWNPDVVIVACPYATRDLVEQTGLLQLSKPVVVLNNTEIDIVSRPGPLITYAPQVIHSALTRGLANMTQTRVSTTSIEQSTYSQPQGEISPQITQLPTSIPVTLYVIVLVVATISGLTGYCVGLRRGKGS